MIQRGLMHDRPGKEYNYRLMLVRKARPEDMNKVAALAARLGLDYPGMESDDFWVAETDGEIVGLVGLKTHSDCVELCSLGVGEPRRGRGTGAALVRAALASADTDIFLGTTTPGFFTKLGFEPAAAVPETFRLKRLGPWCEGCDVSKCSIMVRKRSR
jgi:N-acetylglutamate synthase-like GNAT family acetyltransferase